MVTVVTIKMGQGAVSKTPSPSSQPSQCLSSPQKNPQILRRPDGECVEDREPFMIQFVLLFIKPIEPFNLFSCTVRHNFSSRRASVRKRTLLIIVRFRMLVKNASKRRPAYPQAASFYRRNRAGESGEALWRFLRRSCIRITLKAAPLHSKVPVSGRGCSLNYRAPELSAVFQRAARLLIWTRLPSCLFSSARRGKAR